MLVVKEKDVNICSVMQLHSSALYVFTLCKLLMIKCILGNKDLIKMGNKDHWIGLGII